MTYSLRHFLLATLAALLLSGCTSSGGAMNWGPFQRRSDTADTIPLSGGTAAAPAQQTSSSGSWLPSWMGGSSTDATSPSKTGAKGQGAKNGAQANTDGSPNLDSYQPSIGSRLAKGRELERAGRRAPRRLPLRAAARCRATRPGGPLRRCRVARATARASERPARHDPCGEGSRYIYRTAPEGQATGEEE